MSPERILSSAVAALSSASVLPCPEHNFVTLGPNNSKLGMHVSTCVMRHTCFIETKFLVLPYIWVLLWVIVKGVC